MTSRLLLTCLVKLVQEAFVDYPFPAPQGGGMQPVQVFLHGLPERQQEGCYPFVIVRWIEGQVELEPDHKTMLHDTVGLALGVYSPADQEQAGLLLAEMLDCLRRQLWKTRLLAERFELEGAESQYPYAQAALAPVSPGHPRMCVELYLAAPRPR